MKPYFLGLYEKSMPNELSVKQKLQYAKKAGFDYLELSIDETDEKQARLKWSSAQVKALVAAQAEIGIPILSICLSGHRKYPFGSLDENVQIRALEMLQEAVNLAVKLGVHIIQLAGYDVYYEEASEQTKQNFKLNLAKAVAIAAKQAVILGFETMETEFLNTVEKAMFWVRENQSPYLQVYPDVGNLTNAAMQYSTDVNKDLRAGRGHIVAVHLKETKPKIFREVPYGEGHVDFNYIVKQCWDLGVRMFVAEFWYVGNENWQQILEDNNKFLRDKIEKAWAEEGE